MTAQEHEASPNTSNASSDADSTGEVIFTPPDSELKYPASTLPEALFGPVSASTLRLSSLPAPRKEELDPVRQDEHTVDTGQDSSSERESAHDDDSAKSPGRPHFHRPSGGLSRLPLLTEDKEDRGRLQRESHQGSARPLFASRRSTFRSRSPSYAQPANTTRRKYTYAAFFLLLSLISFVVQTETAVYIQHDLKWNKHYCMLWLTHGSWSLLWPMQLLIIRLQKRKLSWSAFWRRHKYLIRTTAQMAQYTTARPFSPMCFRSSSSTTDSDLTRCSRSVWR